MSVLAVAFATAMGCTADAGSDVPGAHAALGEGLAAGDVADTARAAEADLTRELVRAHGAEARASARSARFAALEEEIAATDDATAREVLSAARERMLGSPEALADGLEVMQQDAEAGDRYVPTPGDLEAARRLEEYRIAELRGVRP